MMADGILLFTTAECLIWVRCTQEAHLDALSSSKYPHGTLDPALRAFYSLDLSPCCGHTSTSCSRYLSPTAGVRDTRGVGEDGPDEWEPPTYPYDPLTVPGIVAFIVGPSTRGKRPKRQSSKDVALADRCTDGSRPLSLYLPVRISV